MQSAGRQARADKILATAWNPNARTLDLGGQSLNGYLRNETKAGTNHSTLAEMITPWQVITGGEPENAFFEANSWSWWIGPGR